MCVRERHPPTSETVYVGCLRLRMTAERTDPVVEVIDGDQENVGVVRSYLRRHQQR